MVEVNSRYNLISLLGVKDDECAVYLAENDIVLGSAQSQYLAHLRSCFHGGFAAYSLDSETSLQVKSPHF